jgi:predicted DNA-binding protein (MmcQ/YjbR family)
MVSLEQLREIALSFPQTTEEPHFDKTSFRVKKKIFATFDAKNNCSCLKLSEIDQDVFSSFDKSVIYPVANKWGKQGWTFIEMQHVDPDLFLDALTCAYHEVATPIKTKKND